MTGPVTRGHQVDALRNAARACRIAGEDIDEVNARRPLSHPNGLDDFTNRLFLIAADLDGAAKVIENLGNSETEVVA